MTMDEASDPTTARHAAILDAATGVFLRYGFKKTSMDDLAWWNRWNVKGCCRQPTAPSPAKSAPERDHGPLI